MARYYSSTAPKEEAAKFFEEYAAKYPDDPNVLGAWLARITRDKEPLEKGIELAEKIEALNQNNPVPEVNERIANFYFLKNDQAKAEEIYGKQSMELQVSLLAYNLVSYANFWAGKSANLESAVAMAELAIKLPPESSYILRQAASVFIKAGKEDKALATFGPAYAKKNAGDADALYSYGRFWSAQGKNLDDALYAAKKSVELLPRVYYLWSALGEVHLRMKSFAEAIKAAEKAVELAQGSAKDAMKKNLERIQAAAQEKK
jgi:tetratricopeptide (TPR) repeat protein